MAEYITREARIVAPNADVLFEDEVVSGTKCITHRYGSGLINLKGITNQCKARFKVTFNGDVAIPASGTVGAVTFAIAIDGEPVQRMVVTPTATGGYWNIASSIFVDVPKCCCAKVSVKNVNAQNIAVQNANILVERVA